MMGKMLKCTEITKYREVKRPAKVGERIRVTNRSYTFDVLGDNRVVTETNGDAVMADGKNGIWAYSGDAYVVLEPIEETKEENMEVCEAMATPNYEAENENLRRLCNYQREKNRQLLKAYVNLARYIDICEDGKIRGLEGL